MDRNTDKDTSRQLYILQEDREKTRRYTETQAEKETGKKDSTKWYTLIHRDRQAHRLTGRRDLPTDNVTNTHTDKKTKRQTYRQKNRYRNEFREDDKRH